MDPAQWPAHKLVDVLRREPVQVYNRRRQALPIRYSMPGGRDAEPCKFGTAPAPENYPGSE